MHPGTSATNCSVMISTYPVLRKKFGEWSPNITTRRTTTPTTSSKTCTTTDRHIEDCVAPGLRTSYYTEMMSHELVTEDSLASHPTCYTLTSWTDSSKTSLNLTCTCRPRATLKQCSVRRSLDGGFPCNPSTSNTFT